MRYLLLFCLLSNFIEGNSQANVIGDPMVIESDKGPKKEKEPKERIGGKDGPNGSEGSSGNPTSSTANQEVLNVVKDYIMKYSSLAVEVYQNQIKNNQIVLSGLRGNIVTVGARGLMVLNIAETVKDIKNGKWGSGVCFTVGFAPFPYGTAGSLLCNNALTVIRLVNENPKK